MEFALVCRFVFLCLCRPCGPEMQRSVASPCAKTSENKPGANIVRTMVLKFSQATACKQMYHFYQVRDGSTWCACCVLSVIGYGAM